MARHMHTLNDAGRQTWALTIIKEEISMKNRLHVVILCLVATASFACSSSSMPPSAMAVDNLVASWPEDSRKAATMVVQKYGPPDETTPTMLVWHNTGPWKRTIVYREPVDHDFPMPHKDVWEQFIDYRVPPDKFDDLAAYDGSVIVERT